jgi:hypothetical protein
MSGISDFACDGSVTIGAISMNRLAWMIGGDEDGEGSLFDLLTLVEQRGEDRILPTATGVLAYPRRRTKTEHELRLVVVGDVDQTGATVADHTVGLQANLAYIMANVVAPVVSSTGTRTFTWTTPAGTSLTGPVHVTGIRKRTLVLGQNAMWIGRLLISIPAGALT